MKKLLNTLFITTEDARVHCERETLKVENETGKIGQFPIHMLQSVITFGTVWVSPWAMALCSANGVTISCFNQYGRFLARIEGPVSGNILLRKEQYRISDKEERSAMFAKAFIAAKIANSRTNLQRHLRNYPNEANKINIEKSIQLLASLQEQCLNINNLDSLRGLEGLAADTYFRCFNNLIVQQKDYFVFVHRTKHPPLDAVNALLSFIYTLITHDCRSALEGVGLDPQAGFLHRDRPGRPSLALDLVEEFRAFIADRLVLNFINLKQIQPSDFKITATGAVEMDSDAKKKILTAYQLRKQEEIMHPFFEEKVAIGILFHLQALLLARTIRGDLDFYPAIILR